MSGHSFAIATFFSLSLLAVSISAQDQATPLDDYINNAEMIVIAKCTHVGGVNILLRANVQLEILHVVKGKADVKTLTVDSQYGMTVGQRYLVRIPKIRPDGTGGRVNERNSIIPLSTSESIDELKTRPPRTVVLRTMNLRISQLESDISAKTYELEALQAARRGN